MTWFYLWKVTFECFFRNAAAFAAIPYARAEFVLTTADTLDAVRAAIREGLTSQESLGAVIKAVYLGKTHEMRVSPEQTPTA